MNKLTKRATLVIAIAAMLGSACKKEANDAPQADTANPAATATGIASNAGYRPEILGSIKEPSGVYNPNDFIIIPPYDVNKIYSVPMADLGSITLTINQKTFVYRLNNGDEVLATSNPPGIAQYLATLYSIEVTVIGVDKAQNSQITLRLAPTTFNLVVKEISLKFDARDTPFSAPSVVEYSSLYSSLSCVTSQAQLAITKSQVKTKGVFYGAMAYRAGTWTYHFPFVVSGSFNIETSKM